MVATTGMIGSKDFEHFIGTKAECEDWLEERAIELQHHYGGSWYRAYSPAQILSNKEAKKLRYRDGTRVIPEFDPWYMEL